MDVEKRYPRCALVGSSRQSVHQLRKATTRRTRHWTIWAFHPQNSRVDLKTCLALSSDRDCRDTWRGWRRLWSTPKRIYAHPTCTDSSIRAPIRQEYLDKLACARTSPWTRRGDVVTSGLTLWMKEGKIQPVRRRMVVLSLEWANKTLLTGDA